MNLTIQVWWDRRVVERSWWGQVLRRIRRAFIGTFRPDYIERSIAATREGECHRCGGCCQLVYRCPFLGRDFQNLPYCRIYGELRPFNCRVYPFDRIDSEVENCGYRFKSWS